MKKKDVLNSPRLLELKKQRRKIFWSKILLYFFSCVLIFSGLAFLSRISALNITEIEVVGNKVADTDMVKAVAQEEISGYYLWFFPKTNVLFYPKSKIEEALQNKFKGLKDINFSIKDGQILEISAAERVAVYTWCGEEPFRAAVGEVQPKCYFLDDSGFIFDEAPFFSGEVYFKFFGANFTQVNFERLILFKKTFEAIGLKPVALQVGDNGDIKVFLSSGNSAAMGPEIIFKIDSDFPNVVENLEAALNTEPLMSNFKNKYSSLLYIDLRFGNKVYYKFK